MSLLDEGEFILDRLLPRQREVARMLAMGVPQKEAALTVGYHPAYMPKLKKDIKDGIDVYNRARDEAVLDVQGKVEKGTKDGLAFLLKVLSPDTDEYERTSDNLKVKVAHDFLDRQGDAPKVSTQRGQNANLHVHVTADDLQRLRDAKAGKLREKYAGKNTAEKQLVDLNVEAQQ